jgi:predicted esterase
MRRLANLCPLLLILVAASVSADPAPTPKEHVSLLLAATSDESRDKIKAKLIAADPAPADVAAWFAEGRLYEKAEVSGWQEKQVRGLDGVDRLYALFVPESYDPAKKHLFVIDMHGGVSRPQAVPFEGLVGGMGTMWRTLAAENGLFVARPSGQKGAEWWTKNGAHNLLTILEQTKREFNLDENAVFMTGFSDGGSGSYYMALAHPTPLAGVIPLNGCIPVAGIAGFQVHMRNFLNKPMYATNTDLDSLYASKDMKPFFDCLKELGAPTIWRDIAGFRHEPTYMQTELPLIWEWMQKTRRATDPKRVIWVGTPTNPGRVHWLNVIAQDDATPDVAYPDINPMIPPGRVLIGINVDRNFEGPGVKVSAVNDGSAARAVGLDPGDVIVRMDGADIGGLADLKTALGGKKHGDGFTIAYRRGEEVVEKEGKLPVASPRPGLRRAGKPYAGIEVTVEGNRFDVRLSGVVSFALYLSDRLVDLAKPVEVVVNGNTLHAAIVKPDLSWMIDQALRDQDRTLVYTARLRIDVPAD